MDNKTDDRENKDLWAGSIRARPKRAWERVEQLEAQLEAQRDANALLTKELSDAQAALRDMAEHYNKIAAADRLRIAELETRVVAGARWDLIP
jgi:predicted  nucleic acid-binding Zn-ribbon protein